MREQFLKSQPTAARILARAIKSNRISHAYLFTGPQEAKKLETAKFFAQSVLCENPIDGLACECCNTCQRIQQGTFADLRILDGSKREKIKVEQIVDATDYMQQTALEAYGKKFLIINELQNTVVANMNKLLKFIEEPPKDVYTIICSSHPDLILSTIVSRTQNITFYPLPSQELYQEQVDAGMETIHAHILSQIARNPQEIAEIYDADSYQEALGIWKQFISYSLERPEEGYFFLISDGLKKPSSSSNANSDNEEETDKPKKNALKETFEYFLQIGTIFFHDTIYHIPTDDPTWARLQDRITQAGWNPLNCANILLDAQDRLKANGTVAYVIDELGYQMIQEITYGK